MLDPYFEIHRSWFINDKGVIVLICDKNKYVFCGECGLKMNAKHSKVIEEHAGYCTEAQTMLLRYGCMPANCRYKNLDVYFTQPKLIRLVPVIRNKKQNDECNRDGTVHEDLIEND